MNKPISVPGVLWGFVIILASICCVESCLCMSRAHERQIWFWSTFYWAAASKSRSKRKGWWNISKVAADRAISQLNKSLNRSWCVYVRYRNAYLGISNCFSMRQVDRRRSLCKSIDLRCAMNVHKHKPTDDSAHVPHMCVDRFCFRMCMWLLYQNVSVSPGLYKDWDHCCRRSIFNSLSILITTLKYLSAGRAISRA